MDFAGKIRELVMKKFVGKPQQKDEKNVTIKQKNGERLDFHPNPTRIKYTIFNLRRGTDLALFMGIQS
jgi:hypothetical protein